MKKMLLIAALMIGGFMTAQDGPRHRDGDHKMMNATPEEMAEMQTKKLTLALVLDDAQQKKVYDLELAEAKTRKAKMEAFREARKAGEKPTEDQRKEMRTSMMDAMIAHQEKMQGILTEKQFDQWRKMRSHRAMEMKEKFKNNRRHKTRN